MCDRTVPRVCALGRLVVRDANGNEYIPTDKSERTLLLLLAVNGSSLSVEQALAVLWPQVPTNVGRRRLRNTLRGLDSRYGSLVQREGDTLVLDAATDLSDYA